MEMWPKIRTANFRARTVLGADCLVIAVLSLAVDDVSICTHATVWHWVPEVFCTRNKSFTVALAGSIESFLAYIKKVGKNSELSSLL